MWVFSSQKRSGGSVFGEFLLKGLGLGRRYGLGGYGWFHGSSGGSWVEVFLWVFRWV